MFNAIKVTAFASALPVSQQTKVFLTPRFALLADGSLMPLNFSFLILRYKEFSFAWVRHGLSCILFVELFAPLRGFSTSLVVTRGLHHDVFIASALKNRNISQCRVPHSVALWRFFPPPSLKRYLAYYILADLENKVRHLWWPNFLQPNPTLCLSPQQTSAPPRRALGHAMQSFQSPSYRKNGLI